MTVAQRDFEARALLADHQIACVEVQAVELHGDQPKAGDRRFLAAAKPAERMHLQRDVDHVAESSGK
jgi:hypothetical protein